jgi:hypothetical protein
MVACRKPKTRSAAEASSPQAECRQHHGDLLGRGFQAVQGSVASGSKGGVARLTTERLDALALAMLAIANPRVAVSVGDAEVQTLLIGTGEAFGVHALGGSSPAFHLAPGTRLPQEQVSPLRSRGDRGGNQAECGA